MAKKRSKTKRSKSRGKWRTRAQSADKYELYEKSVQQPEADARPPRRHHAFTPCNAVS